MNQSLTVVRSGLWHSHKAVICWRLVHAVNLNEVNSSLLKNNMTEKKISPSNVYLFFGEDDFNLQKKIQHWKSEFSRKHSANSIAVIEGADLSDQNLTKKLEETSAPSLFSSKKLIIAKDIIPTKATQEPLGLKLIELIEKLPTDYFLIFWQSRKPDKRLKIVKKILSLPINILEFKLPHGEELNAEIKKQAQDLKVKIDENAVEKLAELVGRDLFEEKKAGGRIIDRKEAFNLWEVHSELQKLGSFTDHVNVRDVEQLVKPRVSENVFLLTEEINNKNQAKALAVLENLLSNQTDDEKTAMIKIVGLLAEQIRSLILVKILLDNKLSQSQIAEKLGWSSGRVFITLKHSRNSNLSKLKFLLGELLKIDEKIKTQDVNPKLLLDLFIAQAAG